MVQRVPSLSRCSAALVLALGGALPVSVARAAAPQSCLAPQLDISLPPGAEWQTASSALSKHVHGLSDLDRCARVSVRPDGSGVLLKITASDGRIANRRVDSVADLLRAAEALLVLPPPERPPIAAVPLTASAQEFPPPEPPRVSASQSIRLELGIGGALRVGGGPVYAGGGLAGFADFSFERWLLVVTARLDIADAFLNQPTPMDFMMESSAIGASVGRRARVGRVNVDALLGPCVVIETQSADDGNREVSGAAADFRLALAFRVSGPRSSALRPFVSADFDASAERLRTRKQLDEALPRLPWWSSGVAVGVMWGAR